ncbi:MAG: hypothetical protein JXA69_18365 [Phycisphaerae bacterium]|nr:hypothetical protein [Phycisphaerae bacterium]
MRWTLQVAASLTVVALVSGCQFTTPEGRALKLRAYDSVVVESVELAPEVTEEQIAPLVEGHTLVAVLESKKWKLAEDFDLEAFSKTIETYATMPGTIDGKPVDPIMTREEFIKEHAKANERRKALLDEPKGTQPIHLRIRVTELRFPSTLEGVTLGTQPRMRARVDVYADGTLLGGGDMEAVSGIPGVPLHPGSIVGRAAKAMIFDELKRETILKLVDELADETVSALSRSK